MNKAIMDAGQEKVTLEKRLEALGLKPNEAAVYLAVLKLGEPGVGQIQSATGLHKQLIYLAAETLSARRLLSIHELRGRKRFSVEDPAALEHDARMRLTEAQALVPELLGLASADREVETVRTFRGVRKIQQYYIDQTRRMPRGDTILVLGIESARYYTIFDPEGVPFRAFEATRRERDIKQNLLMFNQGEKEARLNASRYGVELRVLESEAGVFNDIMIWHDRVAFLFYSSEPYLLDIAGQETVRAFTAYFGVLWRKAKHVGL